MKKNIILTIILLVLFPTLVNAKEINYTDSKITFEINENEWTKTDLTQERTYIDKKWTSDCGMIATGSYDMYNEFSEEDLEGISREYFNYKNLFKTDEFAKTIIDEWNGTYNISNWSYKNYGMKFLYATGTVTQSGIDIDFDMYLTINNGYGIMFQYMKIPGVNNGTCSNTIEQIVKSANSTIKVKEENDMEDNTYIISLLFGLVLTIICYMAYPFIRTKLMHVEYDEKSCKKMALWNSIIVGGIFLVLTAATNPESTWSAAPAFLYYWINKTLWISKNNKQMNNKKNSKPKEEKHDDEFKCDNCGAIVKDTDKYCKNCRAIFIEDEEVENEDEEETFTCDNCGAVVGENDKYCKNCNIKFEDEEEDIENELEETEEELFKCDNCGSLVKESATKCPNCGETFEEDEEKKKESDMDQKYSDLTKLKKLLDKEIISKEEFEKEKKKILNKK